MPKLTLNKETIRSLTDQETHDVVGGPDTTADCSQASHCACPSNTCPPPPPTSAPADTTSTWVRCSRIMWEE